MLVKDKEFELFIKKEVIQQRVYEIAKEIEKDFQDKNPLFLSILNGSFIFTADLIREISGNTDINFVKLSSYEGMLSTGKVKRVTGLEGLTGRNIIILEDIVDTGNTLFSFIKEVQEESPLSISVATLLFKPDALKNNIHLDYIGFEIPDKFVVGYGLDYDGAGRNLKDIYQLKI